MATDLRGRAGSSRSEFAIGAGVGLAANFVVGMLGWLLLTRGEDVASDRAGDWFGVVVIAAFAVVLAAILFVGHRSWVMCGVVTGTAITIPIDLVVLWASIGYA